MSLFDYIIFAIGTFFIIAAMLIGGVEKRL